jgi:hypothetical protein
MKIMNDIIDANEARLERPFEMNFKLIAFGILAGLAISAFSGLLAQFVETVFFRLGIYGVVNILLQGVLSLGGTLLLFWLIFRRIKSGLEKGRTTIPQLLKYAIIAYAAVFILQFAFPFIFPYEQNFAEGGTGGMIEEIGKNYLLDAVVDTATYLLTIFGAVFMIIGIGRRDSKG